MSLEGVKNLHLQIYSSIFIDVEYEIIPKSYYFIGSKNLEKAGA
jgi:hypothetical protein